MVLLSCTAGPHDVDDDDDDYDDIIRYLISGIKYQISNIKYYISNIIYQYWISSTAGPHDDGNQVSYIMSRPLR